MKKPEFSLGERLKELRVARGIRQSDLDLEAGLPTSSISKIEAGRRQVTAEELIPLSKALSVPPEVLLSDDTEFIYKDEIEIIKALREISFKDYKNFLVDLEAFTYYKAKGTKRKELKKYLLSIVDSLRKLQLRDNRPRGFEQEE